MRESLHVVREVRAWLGQVDGARADRVAFQCRHEEIGLWCRAVSLVGHGLFVIDEAHLYASRSPSRDLVELVRVCRHARADLVLIAQRPAGLCPDIRSQVDLLRCWQFTEPRDLVWIAELAGESYSSRLRGLRNHASLLWDPSKT